MEGRLTRVIRRVGYGGLGALRRRLGSGLATAGARGFVFGAAQPSRSNTLPPRRKGSKTRDRAAHARQLVCYSRIRA